jgi:subtilase family serine protease
MTARLDTGGGNNVTLECGIDPNNIVQELNNNNNFFSITTPLGMP